MGELQHLAVVIRVAVRVDYRVAAQVVALENAARLCRSRTVTVTIPASEPAVTVLEFRADEFHANTVAPRSQVDVKRRGHDDDRVAFGLVPPDALERMLSNNARKHFRRVSTANLTNRLHGLALEANSRNDRPCLTRRDQP